MTSIASTGTGTGSGTGTGTGTMQHDTLLRDGRGAA